MLRDDAAGPDRWLEAAGGIVQPSDTDRPGSALHGRRLDRRQAGTSPMKGEVLRSRRDPSVSELLARRVSEIARSGNPLRSPDIELHCACQLALVLDRWDEQGGAARPPGDDDPVPRGDRAEARAGRPGGPDAGCRVTWPQFTVIRAEAGDREALDEYAAWVRKTSPEELKYQSIDCFEPMWTYPDHPAIAEAARWLFNDPQSPWVPLLRARESRTMLLLPHMGASTRRRWCGSAGFREGLIAAMAEQGRDGDGPARRSPHDPVQDERRWRRELPGSTRTDLDAVKPGVDLPFRVCDFLAWKVSSLEGAPGCELYWPEDRRDRAVAGVHGLPEAVRRSVHGRPARRRARLPREEGAPGVPRAGPAGDPRGRPRGPGDLLARRAGRGPDRRRCRTLPIKARWVTLKDFPVDRQMGDGTVLREYEQDGWIWQAEEVRKGDRWERSYGFVGPHVIARVPAAEIELRAGVSSVIGARSRAGWTRRIEPVEPRSDGYEPGRPILMAVRIRNRRGVENTAPTEFLRRGDDGRPALRRGVALAVFYSPPSPSRTGPGPGRSPGRVEAEADGPVRPGRSRPPAGAIRSVRGDAARPERLVRPDEARLLPRPRHVRGRFGRRRGDVERSVFPGRRPRRPRPLISMRFDLLLQVRFHRYGGITESESGSRSSPYSACSALLFMMIFLAGVISQEMR